MAKQPVATDYELNTYFAVTTKPGTHPNAILSDISSAPPTLSASTGSSLVPQLTYIMPVGELANGHVIGLPLKPVLHSDRTEDINDVLRWMRARECIKDASIMRVGRRTKREHV
jgi:hypothetical protein